MTVITCGTSVRFMYRFSDRSFLRVNVIRLHFVLLTLSCPLTSLLISVSVFLDSLLLFGSLNHVLYLYQDGFEINYGVSINTECCNHSVGSSDSLVRVFDFLIGGIRIIVF